MRGANHNLPETCIGPALQFSSRPAEQSHRQHGSSRKAALAALLRCGWEEAAWRELALATALEAKLP
jgi:hypothetical protein